MCVNLTKIVTLCVPRESSQRRDVPVDFCIADEIQELNNMNVHTLSCCCGHGKAGQIVEYENGFGKWKQYVNPPSVLIDEKSVDHVKKLGYIPFPYYYADGEHNGVWQMYLKTGCVTQEEALNFLGEENNLYDKQRK